MAWAAAHRFMQWLRNTAADVFAKPMPGSKVSAMIRGVLDVNMACIPRSCGWRILPQAAGAFRVAMNRLEWQTALKSFH
jgi:hypothetical protein